MTKPSIYASIRNSLVVAARERARKEARDAAWVKDQERYRIEGERIYDYEEEVCTEEVPKR